ncbi:alpha/beta hydrolase [Zophobihabitans entericus]|uniref:Alpha/beta hydrolase n=1 Tax=Zophobihabitans entericus TaxID=1635327 RepID=A0A6G9IC54_9GAMM|nr:alpha/beta hydrolase [Zophobihabitans entericus]QIQ21417.1 alpha/beta hydrolase [Zophobihabitans entericus]
MKLPQYLLTLLLMLNVTAQAQEITKLNLPVPSTVSKEMQPLIAAEPFSYWNSHPKTPEQWKSWVNELAQFELQILPGIQQKFAVTIEQSQLANVNVFTITPKEIAPNNQERLLLHFHGGGYVLNPGKAGLSEAVMMAGYGQIKVISVDYRMPPDFPYPAAIDDAIAVYQELIKTHPTQKLGVFGTSTGGGMSLILALRASAEGLPLPAAIAAGTPWTDLTKTGDSYFTHEGIDNVLVSYDGWLGDAAQLYANGHDLTDPYLSPVYGNVKHFPPTLLITATRDLFLSNTIRMHWTLKQAEIPTDLIVFEGLSHAQYLMSLEAPENQQYFKELSQFFDKYLEY